MNPYAPSFSMIAARITEPAVGASTWASGSQVWNGNIGTLIARARKNAAKASSCSPSANPVVPAYSRNAMKSNEPAQTPPCAPWYANAVARTATSISSDPTSVYRTNLIVA